MSRLARLVAGLMAVMAIVALVGIAGCSSTPKQSDNQSTDNPLIAKPETSTTPPAKLITAEEVAKISGIAGVKVIPKGQTDKATGTLNFANDKGGVFLLVVLGTADQYDSSLDTDTFGEKSSGVGDASFVGPSAKQSKTPNILVFKKGADSVALTTFFSGPETTVLSVKQLKEIGKIIASRL
jgi:hypothetical protein